MKRTIAPKALERFKGRIREITRRAKSVSIETRAKALSVGLSNAYFKSMGLPSLIDEC